MTPSDDAHAWWSRLRHQGLLLSPVVMLERYGEAPQPAPPWMSRKLRDAYTRFLSKVESDRNGKLDQAAILEWVDLMLIDYASLGTQRLARQHSIPGHLTAAVRSGSREEVLRPQRVLFADEEKRVAGLLVMADTSRHVGRGRGRTAYARFLELLRSTGERLGLLTNGFQFRLVYAGLDFESWCEWESGRWFDDGEGTEELGGLRQLLSPDSLQVVSDNSPGLLSAIEESRKKQADLSSVLGENVRRAVEQILVEVSAANRENARLFQPLSNTGAQKLSDREAHEALLQATVRVVMRLVVCLFAESRGLLPVQDPVYAHSYGVRSLYELFEGTVREEGGTHGLFNRQLAWPRLMALFRLIYAGSAHGAFPLPAYGGALFRPGEKESSDPVTRALFILEHSVPVRDSTIRGVLRKLLRGPLPVMRGKVKTYIEGPVDYTDLRTEFIGLIYEGLLDYRLKRTDEEFGPVIFLNLGREPVLPLVRLESMLNQKPKELKNLLTKLKKEKATSAPASEDSEDEAEELEESEEVEEEKTLEWAEEREESQERAPDYLDAETRASRWARKAVRLAGLIGKKLKRETPEDYERRLQLEADQLIKRVVATGEFYLVRAGNTRKGTGTFYTRPQLAVPTVHRTLQPLCYEQDGRTQSPKNPEQILNLKVCDPACGSASFLVAALHYLTEALYGSLRVHAGIEDPERSRQLTLPFGRLRQGRNGEELIPFPPDDPQRGDQYSERIKAILRRHVVERCIYGVDFNPLAVEFARVSLWVETLDRELPFTFLDHKIKVGNALVGCWLDRVEDYPLKAWERSGGDGKGGPRDELVALYLKGDKKGNRRTGDGIVKQEMRQVIENHFSDQIPLFKEKTENTLSIISAARRDYDSLHDLPIGDPEAREVYYRQNVQNSENFLRLKTAMDEWCAVWFWPLDEDSIDWVPTPLSFHRHCDERANIVGRLVSELKFFHWELEFPDAFTPDRSGFDAVVGNPPWETVQLESKEFFSDYDPNYRSYGNVEAKARQKNLLENDRAIESRWNDVCTFTAAMGNWVRSCSDPFDVPLSRKKKQKEKLAWSWAKERGKRQGYIKSRCPFAHQGSGKLYTYKMFTEIAHALTRAKGRFGLIVPSGLYSDKGTKELRRLFLEVCDWDWLFGFENRKKIFPIDSRFKFATTLIHRDHSGQELKVAFMIRDLARWEQSNPPVVPLDTGLVSLFSPKSRSIPEVRTRRDLEICRNVYQQSVRIGDQIDGWEVDYSREFNMTDDSKLFPPLRKWMDSGYLPDAFGRWIGPEGEIALPLYEGRMIGNFEFFSKGWVKGKGRGAKWREIPVQEGRLEPQYLMSNDTYEQFKERAHGVRLAFMDVSSATNTRTMISVAKKDIPSGNSAPALSLQDRNIAKILLLSSVLNSFAFDFCARQRLTGLHLNWYVVSEFPIPRFPAARASFCAKLVRLLLNAASLSFVMRWFAPEWLVLKHRYDRLGSGEWKSLWAITEADRLRLKVEIDSICADLYGLEPDEFDWVVRDDPDDPKGFWRIDKELPFPERQTGLAAAAFRALMDGKWSAKNAEQLTNDQFFEILGIPELTNPEAAKAMGYSEPLIRKRSGCHLWEPQNFPEEDPRHGWTWEDCMADAVELLGSAEVVKAYVEPKKVKNGVPFKLRPTPVQGRLF